MGYNVQKTTSTGLSVGMQTWCDKIMLEYSVPELVHAQGATQKNIPANSGKVAQWRRWTPLEIITDALTEAEIPDGQDLTEEQVLAYIYQYGGYTTKSDLFDLTHMDADLREIVALMANQGARSVDAIIRDVMAETTTIQYANSKTAIYSLLTTDELNVDEIRKMVRTLKKNLAPRFTKGGMSYYLAILGPDGEYDIMSDTKWRYPKEYVDTKDIYQGELGMVYGVRFLQTTEGLEYENDEPVDGQLYVTVASWAAGTYTATIDEAMTAAEATALAGKHINMLDATDSTTYERVEVASAASGAAGTATITLTGAPTMTPADGDTWYANEYGYTGNPVYGTFVFGKGAYATADINGSGKLRTIVKTAAEIGGPLEQFGTVGWKVPAMACAILQPLWLGLILHGASA